jgi:hypothetical protein
MGVTGTAGLPGEFAPRDEAAAAPPGERRESTTSNEDRPAPLDQRGRVCATGAAVFASALERVALLNGIPREERSWRHSSIASRIRFLLSLAADPSRAARFERVVRRTKVAMLLIGLGGSMASLLYWRNVGTPALFRLQTGEPSQRMVSPVAER